MEWLTGLFAVALVLLGIAGTALPMLPGAPLVWMGLWLLAMQDGYAHVGWGTLGILFALMLCAALVDHFAAVWGVRRVGASARAMAGAFIGGVLGIFGGLPGVILGPVIGALVGELLAGRDHRQASRVGLAAGLSFVLAIALKLGLVFAMLGVFGLAWWLG